MARTVAQVGSCETLIVRRTDVDEPNILVECKLGQRSENDRDSTYSASRFHHPLYLARQARPEADIAEYGWW